MRIQTNPDQTKSNLVQFCQIQSNSIKPKSKSSQIQSNPVKPKSKFNQIQSNPNPNPVKSNQTQIQIWSNLVKPKSKFSQTQSNPNKELDLGLTGFGFGASLTVAMSFKQLLLMLWHQYILRLLVSY